MYLSKGRQSVHIPTKRRLLKSIYFVYICHSVSLKSVKRYVHIKPLIQLFSLYICIMLSIIDQMRV